MSTVSDGNYILSVDGFEGPLELLLTLIEKRKLLINDVSLAAVTDDFINHLQRREISVAERAHFILVASTLLLIKSKSLLPILDLSSEEEESIEDLEHRLAVYHVFKNASRDIATLYGTRILFDGGERRMEEAVFAPARDLTVQALTDALSAVIARLPKIERIPEAIVERVVSLEDTIERLTERVEKAITIGFRDFAGVGKSEKVEVIVSFLAMLELVKDGIISVRQRDTFDDIIMETENVSVPKYS
ncbi:hypothetical protein COU17_00170 [Candidatus Kaiserbacteria bacterium CG10_big_fil_rev_8_21_14_0_10_49_17]|uniref:Segregation and condensation protein A n=1 Tax=Candidatus Kaiserbacteria bacterium CG10_big_fil_rev_8_21_14_0_10_49_17 TaxID=1974609 RepID=A0A2M6WF25_9BACT|nr:MAG: hypothetical protein COU17_00170 [Candidatus Kaiserbacteria bacterium CG10_big_fil_rev_8_21_14_0_10_49_17]